MTPDRIANAIVQDSAFRGVYVLVEGKKDLKMYRKFFSQDDSKLRQTWGKYSQRRVWDLLRERGYTRKIAIRDADFLRIPGNEKFDPAYSEAIFTTDCHDAEMVAVEGNVLDAILTVTHDVETLERFQRNHGSLREAVKRLARPIGLLRLANKRGELGLSFKPARPDGNALKYHKFIDPIGLSVDIERMINTVWEYSKNRGLEVSSPAAIKSAFDSCEAMELSLEQLINGHDFSEIISYVSGKALKCTSKVFSDGSTVEEALAIGFTREHFGKTSLFASIDGWQKKNCAPMVLIA